MSDAVGYSARVAPFEDYETATEVAARLSVDSSQVRRYCEQDRFEGAFKPHPRMWLIPRGAMPTQTGFGRPPSWARDTPNS